MIIDQQPGDLLLLGSRSLDWRARLHFLTSALTNDAGCEAPLYPGLRLVAVLIGKGFCSMRALRGVEQSSVRSWFQRFRVLLNSSM